MRKVIFSMNVSLDGFIAGPAGELDWSEPDEELHRFHNRGLEVAGVHLCGRRLYEVMAYWDDPEQYSSGPEHELEFARIWQDTPKLVLSTTLEQVGPNATLAKDGVAEEVARLREQPGGDIAVGGAGLAGALIKEGLVDEFQLFVRPIVLGAGIPYFPALDERIALELVETRAFASAFYLRYRRA